MAIIWLTPSEVTPGSADAWTDVDVSGSVPAGATGIILHFVLPGVASEEEVGWRKNGSTDNRTRVMYTDSHFWCAVGVDASRICELYVGHITNIDVYLVGYFGSESSFFTNAPDKSLGSTGAWTDIDISADTGGDTAIGAIVEVESLSTYYQWGLRKNGSSDDRRSQLHAYHCGAIMGVDGSEILEGHIENTNVNFYLSGYVKSGATLNTNATDLSLGSTGSWIDLSALPAGAVGGFIEVYASFVYQYGLRKNGSAETILADAPRHPWGMVECDGSQLIEGQIENVGVDFFLVGYAEAAGGQTYQETVEYPVSALSENTDKVIVLEPTEYPATLLSENTELVIVLESLEYLASLLTENSESVIVSEALEYLATLLGENVTELVYEETVEYLASLLPENTDKVIIKETQEYQATLLSENLLVVIAKETQEYPASLLSENTEKAIIAEALEYPFSFLTENTDSVDIFLRLSGNQSGRLSRAKLLSGGQTRIKKLSGKSSRVKRQKGRLT